MEEQLEAILIECHKAIEESASIAASKLVNQSCTHDLIYPPNAGLSESELRALESLKNTPELESALRKIIANAAAIPLFSLFSCIDGVADPSTYGKDWFGLRLSQPVDDESDEMLHDSFFEMYWRWQKIRNGTGWKLDNL